MKTHYFAARRDINDFIFEILFFHFAIGINQYIYNYESSAEERKIREIYLTVNKIYLTDGLENN